MDQPPPLNEDAIREDTVPLPPFQSAKKFPISPKAEKLPTLYPECLQALKDANEARRMLRARMVRKKRAITEMRVEIERLEHDLALEAETRIRLHAMNENLLAALRKMKDVAEDVATTVEEAHRVPRTGLGRLIEILKQRVRSWWALKAQLQQAMVNRKAGGQTE